MSEALDRRSFLGGVVTAAAVAAAAAAPLTARALARAGARSGSRPTGEPLAVRPSSEDAADGAWHIDDMWGHAPRYAHPIPHAPMGTSPVAWEHVDPIDRMLVL